MNRNRWAVKAGALLSGLALAALALSMQPVARTEAAPCKGWQCPRPDLKVGSHSIVYHGNGWATLAVEVVNVGTSTASAGTYTFIEVTNQVGITLHDKSVTEAGISAGGKVTHTLGFYLDPSVFQFNVKVYVDGFNIVSESNELNNKLYKNYPVP
jgi:hypothetical protein